MTIAQHSTGHIRTPAGAHRIFARSHAPTHDESPTTAMTGRVNEVKP